MRSPTLTVRGSVMRDAVEVGAVARARGRRRPRAHRRARPRRGGPRGTCRRRSGSCCRRRDRCRSLPLIAYAVPRRSFGSSTTSRAGTRAAPLRRLDLAAVSAPATPAASRHAGGVLDRPRALAGWRTSLHTANSTRAKNRYSITRSTSLRMSRTESGMGAGLSEETVGRGSGRLETEADRADGDDVAVVDPAVGRSVVRR